MRVTRRKFIQAVGVATVATNVSTVAAQSQSDVLRVAVIGFGGRGRAHIKSIHKSPHARVVALADVDQKILQKQSIPGEDDGSTKVFRTTDFREILDRPDVDVITSATPNHWHAHVAIMGVQAGKHVYIEKPVSHNIAESEALIAAADRYGRLIQAGFQNRSDKALNPFIAELHNGEFGKVRLVHGTCHRSRRSIGKLDQPLTIPGHINYDLWLGPAADQPVMRPRLHYDWHWDFNTGNGDVGNQGPHEWDLMNWALGNPDELPTFTIAAGNRFGWQDAGDTPNVMACAGVSGETPFLFEVMDLHPGRNAPDGNGVGIIVYTDQGRFIGGRGRGKFVFNDGTSKKYNGFDATQIHFDNFFDAVKAADRSRLNSDCKVAANSSSMAHMANISYQLGETCSTEAVEDAFSGSIEQRDMLARLRESVWMYSLKHKVDPESWILGAPLSYDNATGKFTGSNGKAATARKSREYRKGFELPKIA